MRSLINNWSIAFILFFIVLPAASQSISNSAYNVFGIGTLEQTGLIPYESMGYAGLGSRPIDMVNLKNPAALNSIQGFTQIFDVGVTFSRLSQESNDASFLGTSGGLHDLNYWFRIKPKTSLSIGISRNSEASYDILDTQSGSNEVGRSDSRHIGEGGSSLIYVAGAHSILPNLHLGLKSGFLFGSFQNDEILFISEPSINLEIENQRSFTKVFIEGGLQYEHRLNEKSIIVLGSTFRTGGTASVNEQEVITSNSGLSVDTLASESNSEIYLPQKVGLGLSLELKSWNINLDYEFENWGSNISEEGLIYKDRFITSFGAQFIKDRFSQNLINRIAFRFGGGIHSNYLSINNEDFLSQYYTLGIGVPISRGAASLNLSYQFYSTGTSASNLITENTSTFGFSVAFRDVWFRKRKYD